ncbi:MAG: alanine racemase [Acidobacteria bacterium]|nr:alanine racemase [Acidobacteriota bacterium]
MKRYSITEPTLLIDEARARRNIHTMAEKARCSGVRFRPHFKTHQSAAVGEWFREAGVSVITVSSVAMAAYFARHGWRDITLAFPVNVRQMEEINRLGGMIKLNLLVENEATLGHLRRRLDHPVEIWLKVDTGYHRTGVWYEDAATLQALARGIGQSPLMRLRGLLAHAGHAYQAHGRVELEKIQAETISRLRQARDRVADIGAGPLEISVGDTPCCGVVHRFEGMDEIRPGNFVFFDVMQWQIGACGEEELAAGLACPVVGIYPQRKELVIYGGAIHLSKERIANPDGNEVYGYAVPWRGREWGPISRWRYVRSLSQEHGIVRLAPEEVADWRVGDLVVILPVHSCLTVNLMRRMRVVESGEWLATMNS